MDNEILAALKRIEAIAHHYSKIVGHSDEITEAFKGIVEEAGDAIAIAKRVTDPSALAVLVEIFEGTGMTGENMDAARTVIAKVRGEVS